jgi:hypothetical protein
MPYAPTKMEATGIQYEYNTGKNTEDSNLANVEAVQWVLLYVSVGHDRSY